MNEVKKADYTMNYQVAGGALAAVLISTINEELLGGQPAWVRITAAAAMAAVLVLACVLVIKRFHRS
jgi:hypothetical protein